MKRFSNVEDGVETFEIGTTGDYSVHHPEYGWFYWLESTSPYENYGPYESKEMAESAYHKAMGE